jgi:hypothetical protein
VVPSEPQYLFSPDPHRLQQAPRAVEGIPLPHGGDEGARALAGQARAMTAFVFVYGVDTA